MQMPMSSALWWKSTSVSPAQVIAQSKKPVFGEKGEHVVHKRVAALYARNAGAVDAKFAGNVGFPPVFLFIQCFPRINSPFPPKCAAALCRADLKEIPHRRLKYAVSSADPTFTRRQFSSIG